jgi:hypothetical protein
VSVKVELERLLEVAADFGTVAMLLTTDADGRPRAAATSVAWAGEVAHARAGAKSLANATARPLVSVLYPAPPGQRFALLVDGEVTETRSDPPDPDRPGGKVGGVVHLRATSAILHAVLPPAPLPP